MANYLITDAQLIAIADLLRAKNGSSASLVFPDDFESIIGGLVKTADANATAADIRNGKTAYVKGAKVVGSIPDKAAATYNTSGADQSIASGQYLTGAQTIKAVQTSGIEAGNIKSGVTVKVGDANNTGRIKNVTGTLTPSLATETVVEDTDVESMSIVLNGSGKYFWSIIPPSGDNGNHRLLKAELYYNSTALGRAVQTLVSWEEKDDSARTHRIILSFVNDSSYASYSMNKIRATWIKYSATF